MSLITTHFKLIAAKAELMAEKNGRWYASDVTDACNEIQKALNEIRQENRKYEAGDR